MSITLAQEKQLNDMYDKYANMLYHVSLSHMQNKEDAEDIVQEVFCKYVFKTPKFSDESHEKAWFLRVTINQCTDYLRKRARQNYVPLHEIEEIADHTSVTDENALDVMHILSYLPDKYRIVVILYYLEGVTIEEIGKILSVGKSAIKMRLFRARKILESEVSKEERYV